MIKKISFGRIILNIILILISLSFILPIILLISISLSSESSIQSFGYNLIPKSISFEAYHIAFMNPVQILNSYKVTIFFSIVATVLGLLVQTMAAYPLSRQNFKYKKFVITYSLIVMLFNGGLIPTYILNSQYLHLNNTIWIYIFPTLAVAWNVIILRTFFQSLPSGLSEAAKIDGASEFRICFQIIIPLSTPVLATLGFKGILHHWNNWHTSLIYIRSPELYSLQYLLQRILREAEFIRKVANEGTGGVAMLTSDDLPIESLRYAMAVIAAGPMMIVFPFFQKYLAKGLVVGSVKG